ncbi:MAG: hypothetical protein NT129_05860 [Candidatus Aenigmarchaeota archaeon]|nr:hypothetical protein [Candidatus Aenigmarchaeota archaeon]
MIFSDADLSADISQTKNMISEIRKGADICIGSRYMPRAKTNRSLTRRITSNTYVFFVKLLFNTKITDFPCGFKAFIKKALPIILKAKDNRWFWDTEMLLKSERKGLKIKQMPVHWKASC